MLLFILTMGVMPVVQAKDIDVKDLKSDLEDVSQRLTKYRDEVLIEKASVAREMNKMEEELLIKRREREIVDLGAKGREAKLYSLRKSVATFKKEADYIEGALKDFSIEFDLRSRPGHQSELGQVENPDVVTRVKSLEKAFESVNSMLGGEFVKAEVVTDGGTLSRGTICNLGPAGWFKDDSGKYYGSVEMLSGATHGRLNSDVNQSDVEALFAQGSSRLKLDVTGGKARAISKIQDDPLKLFEKGGVWLWPILTIAFFSTVCGVIKFIQLSKIKEPNADWIGNLLTYVNKGDLDAAKSACAGVAHPVAEVLTKSIDFVSAGANVVEEVVYERIIGVQSQLQKWLPFIAVTAATAPLLGLLGTVSGMIRMFNVITVTGTGDVKPMAGGISEALVTTLFGLIVAIPALILHTMLSRRSNGVVQATERLSLSFVNGLKSK
ncbi:MotA/TolQ/ExbB proton channel family protein [Rubritalea tangerina]|uniref:MotA/TolQ/ExbB proton channel family protein n=1 Tax=Rubritalea tangerina TaxID=430798 RepID=A0ABW4ZF00_9BACT